MWEFFNTRDVAARKTHRCDECRGEIAAGEQHRYCSGKVEGEFTSYRLCAACALITSEASIAFFDEGFPLGETRLVLRDDEGIEDALVWATQHRAERLTKEALDEARRGVLCGMERAAQRLIAERKRQLDVEGWTLEHDDQHAHGEMAYAASGYCHHAAKRDGHALFTWPWSSTWWKPRDPVRDLERAGALIIAELERLERAGLIANDAEAA